MDGCMINMEEVNDASKQRRTSKKKRAKIWICFQSCFRSPANGDGKKHKAKRRRSKLSNNLREDLFVDHNKTKRDRESNQLQEESRLPQTDFIELQPSASPLTIKIPVLCPILSSKRCRSPCNSSKVVGFTGILVIMLTILVGGRLFAIVCISAWFYLIPWMRSSSNVRIQTCAKFYNKRHSDQLPSS